MSYKAKFDFESADSKYEKKSVKEILEIAKTIDRKKAAEEVIQWLTQNVENFIDNHEKIFRIDMVISNDVKDQELKQIKLLQDLFRAIPDDDASLSSSCLKESADCRVKLRNLTNEVHKEISKSDKLKTLFERMKFYYEIVGINNGVLLGRNLVGEVDVVEFEYEAFSLKIEVTHEKGDRKQYEMEEGFSILLEISFVDQSRTLSIF